MKWSVVGLILVGLAASIATAVLVASIRAGGFETLAQQPVSSEVTIIVASKDIPAMSVVDASAVVQRQVPAKEAPEKYLSNPVQVAGKVLNVPLVKGQPVTRDSFAAGSGLQLAAALEDGMRAVSVSLTDYSGLYGLLYPGSVVDVMASFRVPAHKNRPPDAVSVPLMREVQVLGVEDKTVVSAAQDEDPESVKGGRSGYKRWLVTLMVNPKEAQALQLAMEHGKIALAMRNPQDQRTIVGKRAVSLTQLTRDSSSQLGSALVDAVSGFSRMVASRPRSVPTETSDKATTEEKTDEAQKTPMWEMRIYRAGKAETVHLPLPDLDSNKPQETGV